MKYLKRIITPVIVVLLLAAYLIWVIINIGGDAMIGPFFKIVSIVVTLGLLGGAVTVLYQRIQEIKKEDEDDVISKY